jgi:dienelactone hydrolase
MTRGGRIAPAVVALVALAAIASAVWQLEAARRGVTTERLAVGATPVTVFGPRVRDPSAPVAVIAHGFAGSQQLMHPLAVTLARNGYVAVTFDFPGHGRSAAPMPRGRDEDAGRDRALLGALEAVAGMARTQLAADGRYAVVGHSMASDLVVRHAQAQPAVQATVAISAFAPTIRDDTPADSPRNLLVVVGDLEPQVLKAEALRMTGGGATGGAQPGTTRGRFEDGTARRAAFAAGVEHIGVLYATDTLAETVRWLDAAFGRTPTPVPRFLDARGPWLGLLLAGVVALAWPLSMLLPRVGHHAQPAISRRTFWAAALLPAIATPLLLWPLPTGFLPVLLADYLVMHFGVYGLLTLATLRCMPRAPAAAGLARPPAALTVLALAAIATAAYALLALGVPVDRYVFNLQPAPGRWPYVAAMFAGTLVYFLADERLTRAAGTPRFAYAVTKVAFLASLALAIALDLRGLFFLIIIVPAILLLFVVYGLFSGWAWRRANHYAVPAIANAFAFAWFVAITFPRVG